MPDPKNVDIDFDTDPDTLMIPEVTSEVTPPKKRGRPKKVEVEIVTEDASPPEAPVPVSVKVVLPEAVTKAPVIQTVPALTLAEMERGRETLKKYSRG